MAAQSVAANSMAGSMVIFSGDCLMVHRGEDNDIDVLPMGISSSIKRVHREYVYDKLLEMLCVEFYNGSRATLFLHETKSDPIDDEDLQEFRARCIMIHDL